MVEISPTMTHRCRHRNPTPAHRSRHLNPTTTRRYRHSLEGGNPARASAFRAGL